MNPVSRNPFCAGIAGDDPAHNRAGGIHVAATAGRQPEGFFVAVQLFPGAPERKGDSVLCRDTAAVAKRGDSLPYRRSGFNTLGLARCLSNRTVWNEWQHLIDEFLSGWSGLGLARLPRLGRRDRALCGLPCSNVTRIQTTAPMCAWDDTAHRKIAREVIGLL